MKAERRHELKTNTLARGLEHLPEASRQHGSKVLVAVLAVLLIVFLVRQRITSAREGAAQAAYALNAARADIDQLDDVLDLRVATTQGLADLRREVASGTEDKVRQILELTDDPRLLAEARLARGDLNWKLANFPDLPGAATQPSLQFSRSRKDLLKVAEESYHDVIGNPAAPTESVRTARFGLAAVFENRREWDKAREQYQTLVNDPATPQPFKNQAVERLNEMDKLRRPVLVGPPATAESPATSTAPSTIPSTTQATTQSSTSRASGPVVAPVAPPVTPSAPPPPSNAPAKQ